MGRQADRASSGRTLAPGVYLPAIGHQGPRQSPRQPQPPPPRRKEDELQAAELPPIQPPSTTGPGKFGPRLSLSTAGQVETRARAQRKLDQEIFERAFIAIDTDRNGTVEASEILKVLTVFDKKVDHNKFWKYFKEADTDGSGAINRDEFTALLLQMSASARRKSAKRFVALQGKLKQGTKAVGQQQVQQMKDKKKEDAAKGAPQQVAAVPADGPKKKRPPAPPGSEWMSEMTEQMKSLGSLYQERKRYCKKADAQQLLVRPIDPRMRTVPPRRPYPYMYV